MTYFLMLFAVAAWLFLIAHCLLQYMRVSWGWASFLAWGLSSLGVIFFHNIW